MDKDEALKLAKSWFEANTYGDEAVEVYEAIEQALAAQPAPVQHFNHTSAANSALRDAQNRSYQIAKLSQPAAPVQPVCPACESIEWEGQPCQICQPTPAQPAVPDAMTSADIQEHIEYVAGWNDCRQAMLEMMK
jgi:hypothetical protein